LPAQLALLRWPAYRHHVLRRWKVGRGSNASAGFGHRAGGQGVSWHADGGVFARCAEWDAGWMRMFRDEALLLKKWFGSCFDQSQSALIL
jgi:hypothetical protein